MNDSPALRSAADPVARRIAAVAGAFVLAVGLVALAVLWQARQQAALQSGEQLERAAASAEIEFNRAVMAVDLTLASLPGLLAEAARDEALDADTAGAVLARLQERQLLFNDLALLDDRGQVVGTALRATRRAGPALPPGYLAQVLGQPLPGPVLSDPVVGQASGERSLLIGRALPAAGGVTRVAVAEVPLDLLLPASTATLAGLPGLRLTVERGDGTVLAIQPPDDRALGRRPDAPSPDPSAGRPPPEALQQVARATLYPGLRVTAQRAGEHVFAEWRITRRWTLSVAAAFTVLILAVAGMAQAQWRRLALARQQSTAAAGLLDRALEAMGDALLLWDADDRVLRWNARYVELFPWLRSALRPGLTYRELAEVAAAHRFGPAAVAQAAAWVRTKLAERAAMKDQRVYQQELHSGIVVSIVERRMPDGGIVSVYHDMSATERQLARAKAEAEAANEAKSQFLANMSHEIRTPLNAVLGLNDMLLLGPLDDVQRRHAELIRSSGQLLLALINDILDLSRIEAGGMEIRAEPFEPGRLAEEVRGILAERAVAQGLSLVVEDAVPPGTTLLGDAVRLRQVLFNLVGNALKFTEEGGVVIRLALAAAGDDPAAVVLRLEVQDSGIGIPPAMLPRLFERFTQADNSASRRHGGSGLGLAITREVVTRLGGQITVQSAPGAGSTFSVTLPLRRAPADTAPAPRGEPAPPDGPQALHVLVAEDNAVNQILIQAMLVHLGHQPTLVAHGREAVARAAEGGFDLVLMDMQMPELDGVEATRRIRRLEGAAGGVPIVAMTANARPQDRQACLDAGMDDYVSKPIDLGELRAAIARALQRSRVAQ